MQPGAIIAAAIEILDEQATNPGPLDLILQRYVRARRYIGSKAVSYTHLTLPTICSV